MGYGLLKVVGTKPQVITMGVIDLRKYGDHYLKLRRIFERVIGIIEAYLPDELAIEAPFFGKNVQSMLKLGRAQGVAMAAALSRDIPITEYPKARCCLLWMRQMDWQQLIVIIYKWADPHWLKNIPAGRIL